MRKIEKLILHCSASTYPLQNAAWIDEIHREERGFKMIGYHFFLPFSGLIEKGREESQIGAHCVGQNASSLGICLAGLRNYTEAQFSSLKKLLLELKKKYPDATLHGHCEFSSKECPALGEELEKLKAWYQEIKP